MSTLRTNYVDDVLDTTINLRRKYDVTENEDGSISLEDVTTYTQNGDVISASDINTINEQINTNTSNIATNTTDIATNALNIASNTTEIAKRVNKPTGGDGLSGQVLKTNGDGTTVWANEAGGGGSGPLEESNVVEFLVSGDIKQTFDATDNILNTTFNNDGSITETYIDNGQGTLSTSNVVFNQDGSITTTTTISPLSTQTITLSDNEVTINDTTTPATVTASTSGDGTLSVTTSDDTVATATISSGTITITGVTDGEVTITVKASPTTTYKKAEATITVTVATT